MSTSFFDSAAGHLEHHSGLGKLEARGTLRIALKAGGLQPERLTATQLRAVLEKLMPRELELRGVEDPEAVCHAVMGATLRECKGGESSSPGDLDEIFRRMADD
jgi:hypothetical protein